MKICAIYNAWADCDLLWKSVRNIIPVVDRVYIVWSNTSNRGEVVPFTFEDCAVFPIQWEPTNFRNPQFNEVAKRNLGLEQAKKDGFTHFIMMDGDEFYQQEDVIMDKERMERDDLNGLVCALRVYVGKSTLWCENYTRVPFIQKINPTVTVGDFRGYPFAYEKTTAFIDPTRRPSHVKKIEWTDTIMHHFSYVRKDIELKIRNSSANLVRSRENILTDIREARPGYRSLLYHRELKESEDIFKINED